MSESKWPANVANLDLANTNIRAIAGDSSGAGPDVKVREPNSVGYWRRNTLDVLKLSDRFTRYPENREEKAAWLREERMVKRLMKVQAKVIARYDRMHGGKVKLNMPSELIKDPASLSPFEPLRGDLKVAAGNHRANVGFIPGFVLLFPGETEEAAVQMLSMLKSGGNAVTLVAAEPAAVLLEGIPNVPWVWRQQWERVYNFSESEQYVAKATWKLLNERGFKPDWKTGPLEPGGDYRFAIELPRHKVAELRELQLLDTAIFPVNLPTHAASTMKDASVEAGAGYVLAFMGEQEAVADELLESLRAGGTSVYRAAADAAAPVLAEVAIASGMNPDDFDIPW